MICGFVSRCRFKNSLSFTNATSERGSKIDVQIVSLQNAAETATSCIMDIWSPDRKKSCSKTRKKQDKIQSHTEVQKKRKNK